MAKNFRRWLVSAIFFCCVIVIAGSPSFKPQAAPRRSAVEGCFPLTSLRFNLSTLESKDRGSGQVTEVIPPKYRKRYLKWRNDYLSTAAGRAQWGRYAFDPNFSLTITISTAQAEGAVVEDYTWDDNGRLIGATIKLGNKLDSGYPSSINYPITCALAPGNLPPEVKGTILAATKIAHEFGHLEQTISMDGRLYELQNRLMLKYNDIFFVNGFNVQDPRLVELAREMDGTPVSIKQDRERSAEVGALQYLQERLRTHGKIKMPEPVKQAIDAYYLAYPGRFE